MQWSLNSEGFHNPHETCRNINQFRLVSSCFKRFSRQLVWRRPHTVQLMMVCLAPLALMSDVLREIPAQLAAMDPAPLLSLFFCLGESQDPAVRLTLQTARERCAARRFLHKSTAPLTIPDKKHAWGPEAAERFCKQRRRNHTLHMQISSVAEMEKVHKG